MLNKMKSRYTWKKINKSVSRMVLILTTIIILGLSNNIFSYQQDTDNLVNKVEDAIGSYYNLNLDDFHISNNNGDITIKGDVNTLYDKLRIFDIISDVHCVKKISDMLDIQTNDIPDNIIKPNIEEELSLNSAIIEPDRIVVKVDNGEVLLSGTVSYYREKLMAETIASWQNGVLGISDNINILPYKIAVADSNLKIILGEILKNHFSLEKDISFNVNDGVVEIKGTVSTLWAKQNIEKDFYHVLGVETINLLKVKDYLG